MCGRRKVSWPSYCHAPRVKRRRMFQPRSSPPVDPHVADIEARLREVFATKIKLNYSAGKGSVEISFYSDAEFERLLQLLGVRMD